MSSLYARLARTPQGARALSIARLKYEVLKVLHAALKTSKLTQAQLAERLAIRKSAVNQVLRGDGNVRIATLADYLHAMGYELNIAIVQVGKPREDAVRAMREEAQRLVKVETLAAVSPDDRDFSQTSWHRIGSSSSSSSTVVVRSIDPGLMIDPAHVPPSAAAKGQVDVHK